MSNQTGRWLSIREAALELGTSELTIRRRIKAGRLPSRLEAGKYFVRVDEGHLEDEATFDGERERDFPSLEEGAVMADADRGADGAVVPGPQVAPQQVVPAGELIALLADRTDLAEAAGRATLLQQQLDALQERYATLQEGALALSNRNGWLESKLEEREREIKLLTDSEHRVSWWRRVFLGG